jgi:threonine dehydrogenase-like Zn-dependent dehydrogenase
VDRRLALARRGGASAVIAKPVDAASEDVRETLGAGGPDVVIDSTGNAAVFSAALALVRTRGRVVILGDTGMPSRQHLTDDVLMRAVTVVGAHDSHGAWEPEGDRGIHELFLHLVATGRFDLEGLNTHTVRPADCAAAYRLAADRPEETMGIVFDWADL